MRLPLLVLALLLSACAAQTTEMVACPAGGCPPDPAEDKDPVHKRAVFDLQCPGDKVVITEIDDSTRGARGCGRQATYKRLRFSDDWTMDAASTTGTAPPPSN
jgi:hypothetical protein